MLKQVQHDEFLGSARRLLNMKKYMLTDLQYLMQQLRHQEHGCDWDKEQTLQSLTRYSIEEVYELVDAVEQNDNEHIQEELGDVLFQVFFYAQIAEEEGRFEFADVVDTLVRKLVRRHPHVFANNDLYQVADKAIDSKAVEAQWEAIKQEERRAKQQQGILDDIPQALRFTCFNSRTKAAISRRKSGL